MINDVNLDDLVQSNAYYRINFANESTGSFMGDDPKNRLYVAVSNLGNMYNVKDYTIRKLSYGEDLYQLDIVFGGEVDLTLFELTEIIEQKSKYHGVDLKFRDIKILEEEDKPSFDVNWIQKYILGSTDFDKQIQKYANIVIFILVLILLIRITEFLNR